MSQLQLNEQIVPYKPFEGRNVDQMPKLIADGRLPLSAAGLMQRRLETQNSSEAVRDSWLHNYFDTGDAIAYHPDGRIKIVLDAQPLRAMNAKSPLKNGALMLPDGMYETLQGHEFTRENIQKYVGNSIASNEAKTNPLWRVLARDQSLLNGYVDLIFAQAKQQFSYDTNMGVYVSDAPKSPAMRLWYVGYLRDRSDANGRGGLDNSSGRLVGVAPEALGAKSQATLEKRVGSG